MRGLTCSRHLVAVAVLTGPAIVSSCSSGADDSGESAGSTTAATEANEDPNDGGSDTVADPAIEERPAWGTLFETAGVQGTIAVREVGSDTTHVFDGTGARTQRIPASTFKVLNSMIILETGVLPDTETTVAWDGVEREVPSWNMDHSLRSGIAVSAVWAYQALARQVGEERMAELVSAARYGNADIGGGVDEFWLSGDLRISPLEQLDFLEAMVTGDLPFSDEAVAQVRDILVREQGDGWTWSHKSGTALSEEPTLGWLVGTAENAGSTWVFALNVDLDPTESGTPVDPQARENISRAVLTELGALPSP